MINSFYACIFFSLLYTKLNPSKALAFFHSFFAVQLTQSTQIAFMADFYDFVYVKFLGNFSFR